MRQKRDFDWEIYALDDLLNYEQPTAYIVESTDYNDNYQTPVLTAGKSFIIGYTNETSGIYKSLPVIIFDDFTTSSQYVNFPFKVKSSAMKILSPNTELVLPKFIYYRMQIIQFDHSTHKRYWIQQYSKIKVKIPPIPEQERIVSKIEELFSKLDASVAELQTAKEKLKVYRQAVLFRAFQNLADTITMDQIADMIDPQPSHRTPPEVMNGIPYIGVGDIDYAVRKVKFGEARKVSPAVLQEHLERYTLHKGDFIMGKIGTIGKPFIVPLPQNYTLSANVILIQPNSEKIVPEFLYWQFSSPLVTQQLTTGAAATSQPAFGIKKARLLSIKMCSVEQQRQIVSEIEGVLSICDSIQQTIDTSLQQAEALRQSILKQAFGGRLV